MALDMSKQLVKTWLESYMYKDEEDGIDKAKRLSDWLADHKTFKSHNRHLSRDRLIEKGLKINLLETDDVLQDLTLSVFHATIHTFTATPAAKIVENHNGRAFIKLHLPPQPSLGNQLTLNKPPG